MAILTHPADNSESESPAALVEQILADNPALTRELRHRHTCAPRRLTARLRPHLPGIEAAGDWLLDHVRFAARPTVDTAAVRDAYQAASGNRIEILDFVLAAFLAGYPVFARRGPIVGPRKKPSTYFDFGFDARDVNAPEKQGD